jgi:N6-adenosine-specific RNA methylase IME4
MGPFGVIIADPPWEYRDKMSAMKRTGGGASTKYQVLALDPIAGFLAANEIAVEANAHLWLWATNAFIEQAHQVARAWGFTPKTVVTWVKGRVALDKTGTAQLIQHIGQGRYLRNSTEHVIFAVRGSAAPSVRNIPTAFIYPGRWKGRRHSEKPPVIHEWAERLRPDAQRLELFARQTRPGWVCLGNEVAA